jgi:hypothetical protein
MKTLVLIVGFGIVACICHSIGQIIGDGRALANLGQFTGITNNHTTAEAALIVSHLHTGMAKKDVVAYLETNNIKGWADVVGGNKPEGGYFSQSNGWKSAFYLSNGCCLTMDYAGAFDTNGMLCGALLRTYIESNGVTVISIPLTKAP